MRWLLAEQKRMGGMSWAKIDDGFHSHPKVVGTSLEAIGLFVLSLSWAANHETDGVIPSHVAFFLSRNRLELCDELVQRALWERDETGFVVHDYLDYNPSSASIAKKRKEQAKATRKWRLSRERSVIDHSNISRVSPSTGRDGTGSLSLVSVQKKKGSVEGRRKPEVPWPDDLVLTEERAAFAERGGLLAKSEWGKFHARALRDDARYRDWGRAWEVWCRNAAEWAAERQGRR